MGAAYRISQFLKALAARPTHAELTLAQSHLSAPLYRLFHDMSRDEQAHSLRVLRQLLEQGETHPDLLAAALLHDVGKSRVGLRLWERVLTTLAGGLGRRLGPAPHPQETTGWRRPFAVAVHHPRWGAEMVREAGGSALLQSLIERHQDPVAAGTQPDGLDPLLTALQAADRSN